MRFTKATISVLFLALLAGYVCADDFYVVSGGDGDGTDWAVPLGSIQGAIDLAAATAGPDTIHVAAGTYEEYLELVSDMTLYGGYPAAGGDPATRDRTANPTIIDGRGFGRPVRIYEISNVTVDGFWIQNGWTMYERGGGIAIDGSSSVTINDNNIIGNGTSDWGGGIVVADLSTDVMITNNNIEGENYADAGGGICVVHLCTGVISGNTISGNRAIGEDGGGIKIEQDCGGVTVSGNTISDNTARRGGGIMVSAGSPCTIDGNTIENNTAQRRGGGIYVTDFSDVTISGNTITSNTCEIYGGGGIALIDAGSVTITGNTITGNHAPGTNGRGGGIVFRDTVGSVTNNTITDNTCAIVGLGAGIDILNLAPTIGGALGDCNLIYNNGERDLGYGGDTGGEILTATYNYWGVLDEASIAARIFGDVDFNPWTDDSCSRSIAGAADLSIEPCATMPSGACYSPDIWVDSPCFGWWEVDNPVRDYAILAIGGRVNRIYARFRNNGTNAAIDVEARFYITSDIAPGGPTPDIDPDGDGVIEEDTTPFSLISNPTTVIIHSTFPGVTDDDGDGRVDVLEPGAEAIVYTWWKTGGPPSDPGGYRCVAVVLTPANGDDNPVDNVAQEDVRRFWEDECDTMPIPMPAGYGSGTRAYREMSFDNPGYPEEASIEIRLGLDDWPDDWTAELSQTKIQFAANEASRDVTLIIASSPDAQAGDRGTLMIFLWLPGADEPLESFPVVVEIPEQAIVAARTLSITSAEASPGASTVVYLSITDAAGMTAGDIVIKYDANVLAVGEVKLSDLTSDMLLSVNKGVPGEIRVSMARGKGLPSGSGPLVEIELTVSEDAEAGTQTMLELDVDTDIYDESGAIISLIGENGIVTIKQPGILGDVDGDGEVRANDAIMALRAAVGLLELTEDQRWRADVSTDGVIQSNDAILILRKAVGLAAPSKDALAIAGGQITIMLSEAHGTAGGSVTVPLKVDRINALVGGDICIAYDSRVLRAVDVSSHPGVLLVSNVAEPGMVRIAFAKADRLSSETLAEVKFDILADDVSPLKIQRADLYGSNGLPLSSRGIDRTFRSWAMPAAYNALLQNYPNPFNPETWIPYQLRQGSQVAIRIYSATGELVRELDLGYRSPGLYINPDRAAYWDGKSKRGEEAASGVYFYSIHAGDFSAVRKLTILK